MYTYKTKKLPKNTVEITLSLPKSDIAAESENAFKRLSTELTVEGFRKGKAPAEIARKHLSSEDIYQDMIKSILPKIYEEILKKENFKPIINPKIELVSAKENTDWEIKISFCEKPVIELGKYKEEIKKIIAASKKADIWVPGKDAEAKKKPEEDKSKLINDVLAGLLTVAKVEIADILIEDEVNHRLSKLVDDVQKIGLTTEAYLKSKNLTMDSLKAQYQKEIEDTYKLEFLLAEIADSEKITVKEADLDKLFVNIKDDKEKEQAKANSYYYASILRKQKTLDFLISL